MAITLRSGGATLTHAQLDENFETLGLAHGDTVANLDVSQIIINASVSGGDPRLQTQGTQYDSVRFMRTGQTGTTAKTTGLFVTEYTDAGHTAGQGTGYWTRIKTTDKESHGGAVITAFEHVVDSDNWNARLEFRPVRSTGGTEDFNTSVLNVSQTQLSVQNTGRIQLNDTDLVGLKLTPTAYADLPTLNAGNSDNGKIAFLSTDGASASQNKLIVSTGGSWVYVNDPSVTVAAS